MTAAGEFDITALSFDEVLTELAEFEEFFTDKELSKDLINWLHEDYGVNKIASRMAFKYIAPLVLSKLKQLGRSVGGSWLNKLHDRFIGQPFYEKMSRVLLNTLKTKTDKTFQNAINGADTDALEQLKAQPSWSQLNDTQQGIAHLILSASQLSAQQTDMMDILDRIQHSLRFDLELLDVETMESRFDENVVQGSASWLTFRHRQAELVGREKELAQLNAFYEHESKVSWWAVTGPGGIGKSRLALESIAQKEIIWDVGFLTSEKLKANDGLGKWYPSAPTIIVMDYAATHSDKVESWLDHLIHQKDSYDYPVRVLLLERIYEEQDWWQALTMGKSAALTRARYLFKENNEKPLELPPLPAGRHRQIIENYLIGLDAADRLPSEDHSIWKVINDLTNKGSPLFLGMVAIALKNTSLSDIRNWNHTDLLNSLYQREKQLWDQKLSTLDDGERKKVIDLMAFSTLVNGFRLVNNSDSYRASDIEDEDYFEEIEQSLIDAKILGQDDDLDRYLEYVDQLGYDGGVMQPDLIAEYFLLRDYCVADRQRSTQLKKSNRSKKRLFVEAFKFDSQNVLKTLERCAVES